jgi:hypothetical protein
MQNTYINFKRKRELGEIITDTFKFLRRNFKAIFRNLFKIAGIPFVIFIAASAYNAQSSFGSGSLFDATNPFAAFDSSAVIISTLLVYVTLFLFMTFLNTAIISIVKSYVTNEGQIIDEEVSATVKDNLSTILLTGFSKYILSFIGLMLCVIPGIYIAVPFFLIFPILIFENKSTGEAFTESFNLIKDNWWITFASIFVLGLLWYVISIVFSLPSMIYIWVKMFTSIQEGSMSDPSSMFDMGTVILTVVASALQYIAYVFMPIGAALIYYNLNEQKNQTGTLEQIDRLGES